MEMIVDTSALVAFFVRSEVHHRAARRYAMDHATVRWVILSTVFGEFVTWVRAKVSIADSIRLGRILRSEHLYLLLTATDEAATWDVFCQYDDKGWSYTDCSILAMAHKMSIERIFAFDEHVRQMSGLGIYRVP